MTRGLGSVVAPIYQPVIDLRTGEPLYFEALARSTTRRSHSELLEFAEQYGFIHMIDSTMIEHAASALASRPGIRIGVNVSVATVQKCCGQLVCAIYENLRMASRLVVEITETVPITDRGMVATFVDATKAAGAQVAFDDYGDGHFTFEHVKTFRPQIVKLSESLIANRLQRRREILQIVEFADENGMLVVAEAIETEEQRSDCEKLGIGFAQGFLLGRPMPSPLITPQGSVVAYPHPAAAARA